MTNAGSIGGIFATPINNYPEVAILGFNKIFRKPVAITANGREEVVVRDWTYFLDVARPPAWSTARSARSG